MIATTLWHTTPGKIALKKTEIGDLNEGEVLVESKYSFISQGTESIVNSGSVPRELLDIMRVPYMEGSLQLPCSYGYSMVGEIIDGPRNLLGKSVHLMHPHQDQCKVKVDDIFFIEKCKAIKRASLISNMETAINACWDGHVKAGDKVLVIGFGSVGALTAFALTRIITQNNIHVLDHSEKRLRQAIHFGFQTVITDEPFDVVIHTSASGEGLQMAIDRVKNEGIVVELSWYGSRKVTLELGTSFHYGRKKIISSQVNHIPPHKSDEWNHSGRKTQSWQNIQTIPELQFHEIDFFNLNEQFSELQNDNIFTILKY